MSQYDDGVSRYGHVFFDGFVPPVERNAHMSQAVAGLSGASPTEVVDFAANVHTKLTGNAYVTTPNPTLPNFQTATTAAADAIADYLAAKTDAAAKKQARDDAIAALRV